MINVAQENNRFRSGNFQEYHVFPSTYFTREHNMVQLFSITDIFPVARCTLNGSLYLRSLIYCLFISIFITVSGQLILTYCMFYLSLQRKENFTCNM